MKTYNFILVGGGAAGLSLAYALCQSSLKDQKILIIDRDRKTHNDRTWCFWTEQDTPFEHLLYHTWDQVEFASDTFQQVYDLHPYRYKMLRGIDFYEGMRANLSERPNIEFYQGSVEEVQDSNNAAQVLVEEEAFQGSWVFDSIFKPSDYANGPKGYHYLKQDFKGWEIETPTDAFNPGVVTLFDFRTPQKGEMRFFYILPFSKRRALVEYTLFSANLLQPHEYDRAISDYLENVRQIPQYRIRAVESGVIPMTDMPFPRQLGKRIMAIGTKGGRVKPSSGYAFLRIQQDSAAIVRSLAEYGHPFDVQQSPWRYHQFDTIMLQVMLRQGERTQEIFTRLFQNNPIQRIFRFLDETAPAAENLKLLASLPSLPFLKALLRVKLLHRI